MAVATVATAASEVIRLSTAVTNEIRDPLSNPVRTNATKHAATPTIKAIVCLALSPVTRAPDRVGRAELTVPQS
ncbi:MAG: hypothetical protein HY239_05175 [Mycolicibacterium aromaticivorans]|nr:hypothetical protein [Mycolicibacterium aromaticivorans]